MPRRRRASTVPGGDYATAAGEAGERKPTPGNSSVPHTGDPILGLAAPGGIVQIAGQSLHWSAGERLTLAIGRASHLVVASNLRLHTGQAIDWLVEAIEGAPTEAVSLSLVTGERELDVQAQNDEIKLQSKDQLKIVSADARPSSPPARPSTWPSPAAPARPSREATSPSPARGEIKVDAGKQSFVGPVQRDYPMPALPRSTCKSCILDAARRGTPGIML